MESVQRLAALAVDSCVESLYTPSSITVAALIQDSSIPFPKRSRNTGFTLTSGMLFIGIQRFERVNLVSVRDATAFYGLWPEQTISLGLLLELLSRISRIW